MFSNLTKSRIKCFYIGHKMFLKYKTFSPKSQKGGTPPTLSGSDWLIQGFYVALRGFYVVLERCSAG